MTGCSRWVHDYDWIYPVAHHGSSGSTTGEKYRLRPANCPKSKVETSPGYLFPVPFWIYGFVPPVYLIWKWSASCYCYCYLFFPLPSGNDQYLSLTHYIIWLLKSSKTMITKLTWESLPNFNYALFVPISGSIYGHFIIILGIHSYHSDFYCSSIFSWSCDGWFSFLCQIINIGYFVLNYQYHTRFFNEWWEYIKIIWKIYAMPLWYLLSLVVLNGWFFHSCQFTVWNYPFWI